MSATSQLKVNSLQVVNTAGEAAYLMVINGKLCVLTPAEAANQYALSPTFVNQPSTQLTADPAFQDYISPTVTSLLAGGAFSIGSNGLSLAGALTLTGGSSLVDTSTKGATANIVCNEELITLSTSGATTDSSANLLPASSLILAVCARVTTTITTATDWALGDGTTAARFAAANATLVAGTTTVGIDQWSGAVSTLATGPSQAAAAKLRITTTGTPGAGAIRVTVYAFSFTAPTS